MSLQEVKAKSLQRAGADCVPVTDSDVTAPDSRHESRRTEVTAERADKCADNGLCICY